MTAMAEQHAALQQVREPARAPPERRGSACLAASTCIHLPPHLPASTCLCLHLRRPAPRTQATKQKAVLKMREQKEALGARDAVIAQLREVQQGLREQLQQLQQQPAAHALARQDPPRQGSRPPHNGPHHARREHHPEPPEESSRLPEGVSGLNIQLDGGSGTPIIEQLAEAIAANYGRVIEVLTRLPSLTTAALAVSSLTTAMLAMPGTLHGLRTCRRRRRLATATSAAHRRAGPVESARPASYHPSGQVASRRRPEALPGVVPPLQWGLPLHRAAQRSRRGAHQAHGQVRALRQALRHPSVSSS